MFCISNSLALMAIKVVNSLRNCTDRTVSYVHSGALGKSASCRSVPLLSDCLTLESSAV